MPSSVGICISRTSASTAPSCRSSPARIRRWPGTTSIWKNTSPCPPPSPPFPAGACSFRKATFPPAAPPWPSPGGPNAAPSKTSTACSATCAPSRAPAAGPTPTPTGPTTTPTATSTVPKAACRPGTSPRSTPSSPAPSARSPAPTRSCSSPPTTATCRPIPASISRKSPASTTR